jgi:hypothetical protein
VDWCDGGGGHSKERPEIAEPKDGWGRVRGALILGLAVRCDQLVMVQRGVPEVV